MYLHNHLSTKIIYIVVFFFQVFLPNTNNTSQDYFCCLKRKQDFLANFMMLIPKMTLVFSVS